MIKRLYNYWLRPEIPEEASKYKYQIVHDTSLYAFNEMAYFRTSLGYMLVPVDGCTYGASQDSTEWVRTSTYYGEQCGAGFSYYAISGGAEIWTSRDLPGHDGNTVFYTSDRGTVAYGWSDGGENDSLSLLDATIPLGFHVSGTWKCIVSGTDSAVASFEWYTNDVLIHTKTGATESACEPKPSTDNLGVFDYHCVITFENGRSVTAGDMTITVEAYDPGEDPGGGGDNPGGGGGDDETSLVTGIDLYVYPDTVVPGGRATIEVSVNGIGNYSKAFAARLSGHASSETELFAAGNSCTVWIAEEETAEYVLVTVVSVQDPTVTATEMIYINHSGTEEEGTTQQQLQQAFWKGFAAARAYFQEANVTGTINIAKDAEPTSKAGKLRRSFWQGFVSALVVESVPDGVLISSDGYILRDCNGVYLIAKEDS